MHDLKDLVYRSTAFTLIELERVNSIIIEELSENGSTVAVKDLQMIQLQKVFFAIGMFSYFESFLQRELSCMDGFKEVKKILKEKGLAELTKRFEIFICAVNVLKHGEGKSYDTLLPKNDTLPFNIKQRDQAFFFEGDVSEVDTLIEVDDEFILNCAKTIELVLDHIA